MIKHTIWNEDINLPDWADFLEEEFPELTPEERLTAHACWDAVTEQNYLYLGDERQNLDITLPGPILVIADLGLWDGRHRGVGLIRSGNIADCLQSQVRGDSTCHWYLNEVGDLCCDEAHHDGTNHYLYRGVRPTKSGDYEPRIRTLYNTIPNNGLTQYQRTHYTYRLGDYIANVYGWKIYRGRKEA